MQLFLCPDSFAFTDEVADAAIRHLGAGGVRTLSIGAVAARLNVSRQSLTQRLKVMIAESGSESDPTGVLHQIIVGRFGDRWVQWSTAEFAGCAADGMPRIAVPRSPEEQEGVRLWHALRELAREDLLRAEPLPAQAVADSRRQEHLRLRLGLQRWLKRAVSPGKVDELLSLADGVQLAASDPLDPMQPFSARLIVDRHVRSLADGHLDLPHAG